MSSVNLLSSLVKANKAILKQKLSLLDILQAKYGMDKTIKLFTKTCPIVHASIGQHYRHSMDHIELAALVALTSGENHTKDPLTLRYDLRVRGGTLEKDVQETRSRIDSVINIFEEFENNDLNDESSKGKEALELTSPSLASQKVYASFMLSSDANNEMELESTIGRELGFCAHHAIHHMAMVKVITIQTLGLMEDDLPSDFGKAPSTVNFESNQL
jgi:hypothetical protein